MNQILERVIIFLDHANIFHNVAKLNIRINYKKLKEILTKNNHLVGVFTYMGIPDKVFPKKRNFLNYLNSQGFIIQPKPIKISPDGKKKQKGIDIFIYKDIVELAEEDAYDKAILISGDADFVDVVKTIKKYSKRIEIWSFRKSLSNVLKEEAGKENVHYIDDILDQIKF